MEKLITECYTIEMTDGTWTTRVNIYGCETEEEAHKIGDALARPVIAVLEEIRGLQATGDDEKSKALLKKGRH